MKDKQLAEALTAYFEGKEDEAEKALESMSRTSENPVVFQALRLMNALKNYPKVEIFLKKMQSLYDKDKEAFNQAFSEVKPLLEFYAEKQAPLAQTFLGDMYYFGRGVKQDYTEAAKWPLKAAEQGFAPAQLFLGNMYYSGYIVEKDYTEAVKWFRKAAELGDATAQFWLGVMYYYGEGVKEDDAEAVKWFRKAAELGDASAQSWLGMMYECGEGVKQDYKTAYMWYFLANLNLANLNGSNYINGSNYTDENARNLEKKEGWFSSAKLSPSEAREVKAEATRKYDEIRKRYGLD